MPPTTTVRVSCSHLIAILFATGGVLSCGAGTPHSTTSGSSAAAKLALSTNSIKFGSIAVGKSKSSEITLSNASPAGGPNLIVAEAIATGSGFAVKDPTMPLTLGAGQSSSLTVTFKPSSAGADSGQLSIATQGGTQSALVSLSGAGLAAGELGVNPSAMNFGTLAVGASQTKAGSLTAGGADVTVASASWNGSAYDLSGINFPVSIPAGTSIPFSVTFAPQSSGNATGQISFVSDAATSPTVVTLSGTGGGPVQHSVSLTWNAVTPSVVGYNIYRSTTPGGTYKKQNSGLISELSFTDSSVQSGNTYYYVATSVDSSGAESAYSNLATAMIP